MTVGELVQALAAMPPDAKVACHWDGALRSHVHVIWLAKSGFVALGQADEAVYYDQDRPEGAPLSADNHYWYALETPDGDQEVE